MQNWTHLIRFRAVEDGQVHLGQLVDTARDVGIDCLNGVEVKAFLINGDIFNGTVTKNVLTVDHVSCNELQGSGEANKYSQSCCPQSAETSVITFGASGSTTKITLR